MNEIQITVSRFQQAHRCMIRAEAQVCVCLYDCCACLGIEGSKERLLGLKRYLNPANLALEISSSVINALSTRYVNISADSLFFS